MRKPARKSFDCVENMREIRDRIGAEIAGMNHAELRQWFRAHRYSDPVLQRLANRRGSEQFLRSNRRRRHDGDHL